MTQEEKQLLLIDLCARLPYGVMVEITSDGGMVEASYDMRLDAGLLADLLHSEDDFKPYLRPMSSMTEEEIDRMWEIYDSGPAAESSAAVTDYLYGRYLDCHHLIEIGLALKVKEGMYKIE